MKFSLTTSGVTFQSVSGGIQISVEGRAILSEAAFGELQQAVQIAGQLSGFDAAQPVIVGTVDHAPVATAIAPAPQEAPQTPPAAEPDAAAPAPAADSAAPRAITYPGYTKRGPQQSAQRYAGGGTRLSVAAPRAAAKPTNSSGEPRQRGALVKYMLEWFAANPGPQTVDAVAAAAEAGNWSEAQALRAAVIAALRRSRDSIQRNPDGTFNLVNQSAPRAGRIVRRPARR